MMPGSLAQDTGPQLLLKSLAKILFFFFFTKLTLIILTMFSQNPKINETKQNLLI